MIRIVSFRTDNTELAEIAFSIRTEVFVKEQNVPHELEYDGTDNEAQHYLLYYDEKPVGTARWRITEEGIKLERFAVLAEYRNTGLGGELVIRVLDDILELRMGNKKFHAKTQRTQRKENLPIYLHSQLDAVRFYERHGFVIEGEMFIEAGMEHYKMVFSV